MTDMTKYEVIIYWSQEDNSFIAEVPELYGCAADGATRQLALKNVDLVIKEWIETAKSLGRPIPQPKGRLVFALPVLESRNLRCSLTFAHLTRMIRRFCGGFEGFRI